MSRNLFVSFKTVLLSLIIYLFKQVVLQVTVIYQVGYFQNNGRPTLCRVILIINSGVPILSKPCCQSVARHPRNTVLLNLSNLTGHSFIQDSTSRYTSHKFPFQDQADF